MILNPLLSSYNTRKYFLTSKNINVGTFFAYYLVSEQCLRDTPGTGKSGKTYINFLEVHYEHAQHFQPRLRFRSLRRL